MITFYVIILIYKKMTPNNLQSILLYLKLITENKIFQMINCIFYRNWLVVLTWSFHIITKIIFCKKKFCTPPMALIKLYIFIFCLITISVFFINSDQHRPVWRNSGLFLITSFALNISNPDIFVNWSINFYCLTCFQNFY